LREIEKGARSACAKGIFEKSTLEVQHKWRHEVCKYTLTPHFKLKTAMSLTTFEKREYTSHVLYVAHLVV